MRSSLLTALVAVWILPSVAFAQAVPANDLCAGSEVIPPGALPYLSTPVDITNATGTGDPTTTCQSSVSRGVWYVFTPTVSGTYVIGTCADYATANTIPDTVHSIYTGACGGTMTQVASTSGGCNDNGCQYRGSQSLSQVALTAGTTYYILAYKQGTTAPLAYEATQQLYVGLHTPGANDTCSGAAALQLDRPVTANSWLTTDDYQLASASACFPTGQTASTAPGRDVTYAFTAPVADKYTFRIWRPVQDTWNAVLYLASSCPTGAAPAQVGSCVAAANRTTATTNPGEEVTCLQMQTGETLYVIADEGALTSGNQFTMEVTRCVPEQEPNDTPATANAFACGVTGSNTAGDVDFFDLGVLASGYRVFSLIDGMSSNNLDYDLRVTTSTTTLEYDDVDADTPYGGSSANIAGTPATGARTFLRVNYYAAATAANPYRLYGVVQPPLADATPEVEPNGTYATATVGTGSNEARYFRGSLATPAASTDVDVYRFEAAAGDVVFVSLDGDPLRDNTPVNAAMSLHDANGTMLMFVNDGQSSSNVTAGTALTSTSPTSPGEAIVYQVAQAGTYYVRVHIGTTSTTTTGAGDYLLSISTNCRNGLPQPTLTSVSPASGPTAGGTSITLTGGSFVAPVSVMIGDVLATNVVVSGTTLTATSPANTAGTKNVVVMNADGKRATLTNAFTFVAPPAISALVPSSGPTAGGTTVLVQGTNFDATATVTLGGVPLTIGARSATSLEVITPAANAGPAPLVVTNSDGQTGTATFTYLAPPSITSIAPASGPTAGGTTVVITGEAFQTGAIVKVGTANAQVTNVSATQITAITGAGPKGLGDVQVINPDGQSATATGLFTFVPPPNVTFIDPAVGGTPGGTVVTLTGEDFQSGATVAFDGLSAQVSFVSTTELSVVTPGHAVGAVDVVVANPDGQIDTIAAGFTFVSLGPPPSITSITPSVGSTAGGTTVTIAGENFDPASQVDFGGLPAAQVTFVDATTLTVLTQARSFGTVDVRVRNPDHQEVIAVGGFTYDHPAPQLFSVTPSSGRTAGGETLTLAGNNFLSGATVSLGGTSGTNVQVVNPTTLTFTAPARVGGVVEIVLTNADGKTVTLPAAYTFVPPPALSAISPATGSTLGGAPFTLTGTNFSAGATVMFGNTPAATLTVVSSTTITGTTPARGPGTVSVTVTNPDGQTSVLANAFTFIRPPVLAAAVPAFGPLGGGTTVTLYGQDFSTNVVVRVGGVAATSVVREDATRLKVVTPAGSEGPAAISVENADAQTSTIAGAFTYVAAPVVNSVSVSSGPAKGGTQVVVSGDKFRSGAVVLFGGSIAFATTFVSTTELVAVAPAGAGTGDVAVRNPDGQANALANAFTWIAAPSLSTLSPLRAAAVGGVLITLTGTNFDANALVRIGGAVAEVVETNGATSRVVRAPAGTPGLADVEVENEDGQSVLKVSALEYVAGPVLTAVTPSSGPTSGGTTVQVTGDGFRPGATVRFGDGAFLATVFKDAQTLEVISPSRPAGAVDVAVKNLDGQQTSLSSAFTYQGAAPTIERVSPNVGPSTGGTPLLVTGTGFNATTRVFVDGMEATQLEVLGATSLSARTPAGRVGVVPVEVRNEDGQSASAASAFRYTEVVADAGVESEPDAGTVTDGGVENPEPPSGCGCTGTGGGFPAFLLLGALPLLRRRRVA